jgi:hypothetical protein
MAHMIDLTASKLVNMEVSNDDWLYNGMDILFYAMDIDIVLGQDNVVRAGYSIVKFREEEILAFVAFSGDDNASVLPKAAAGWPPYYREESELFGPGKEITDTSLA